MVKPPTAFFNVLNNVNQKNWMPDVTDVKTIFFQI